MDFHSVVSGFIKVYNAVLRKLPWVVNPYTKKVTLWNKLFVITCLLALLVDPLFLFADQISQGEKCTQRTELGHVMVIVRSVTDFIYLLNMILQFMLAYVDVDVRSRAAGPRGLVTDPRKIAVRYLKGYFALDLLAVIPVPQIIEMCVLAKKVTEALVNWLRISILIQYLPRLYRFFPLIMGQSPLGFVFESAWGNLALNFLTFTLSGHVVGSVWYLLGLNRVQSCLIHACLQSNGLKCKSSIYNCLLYPVLSFPITDGMNWKDSNTTADCFNPNGPFSYGLFSKAVDLVDADLSVKYTYSFFWGFQQISTLCGSLTPTNNLIEVIFTVVLIALGLLLFAFLIGNMNLFLESLGHRKLELSQRKCDIEVWMTHRKLPPELRRKIREYEGLQWESTKGVDEKKLLDSFPEDLQQQILRFL